MDVPPGVVTVMSTTPPACAGEVAVIEVADLTVTDVPGVAPNMTIAPLTNPVPVTVTAVPPALVPLAGLTAVTVGTASYVKSSAALVAEDPADVVTTTFTVPAATAGEVTVNDVAETTLTFVPAAVPNFTVAPVVNPEPVTVTAVLPAVPPAVGLTAETVGAPVAAGLAPLVAAEPNAAANATTASASAGQ